MANPGIGINMQHGPANKHGSAVTNDGGNQDGDKSKLISRESQAKVRRLYNKAVRDGKHSIAEAIASVAEELSGMQFGGSTATEMSRTNAGSPGTPRSTEEKHAKDMTSYRRQLGVYGSSKPERRGFSPSTVSADDRLVRGGLDFSRKEGRDERIREQRRQEQVAAGVRDAKEKELHNEAARRGASADLARGDRDRLYEQYVKQVQGDP